MKFKAHNNALFTLAQCMFVLTVREKYTEKNRDLEIVSLMSVLYSETLISKWNPQTLAFESRVYLVHRNRFSRDLWVIWVGHFTTRDLD